MREVYYANGERAEIGDIWCSIPYTSPVYTIYKTVSCRGDQLIFDQSCDRGQTWTPYPGIVSVDSLKMYYFIRKDKRPEVIRSGFAKFVKQIDERTHG